MPSTTSTDLLRFLTCGGVDHGKSTVIGRMLWECGALSQDQSEALRADTRAVQRRSLPSLSSHLEEEVNESALLDFSLLLDGLAAEREQGITIDVAYRYFQTARRKFIVADTPGHEQYTRNMVTGASTADLALILVDAKRGIQTQTRRHSYLVSLMGIKHVALVVTKMDLVDYAQQSFAALESEYRGFAEKLGLKHVAALPVSGVHGDNLVHKSQRMSWYGGPTLLGYLETVNLAEQQAAAQLDQALRFRLPVQSVTRIDGELRGYAGTVVGGNVRVGQAIVIQPSGVETSVSRIVSADGDLQTAMGNQSITLVLNDERDISRGDLLCAKTLPCQVSSRLVATLIWMHEQPLLVGRSYLLKLGTKTLSASVRTLRHAVNINTLEPMLVDQLKINEIAVVEIELDRAAAFDAYRENRDTGGFILIDKQTGDTVGAGLIEEALKHERNLHWQSLEVNKQARRGLNGHSSAVVWLTGLSGAGKTTIANLLEKRLHDHGVRSYLLDGDNLRHGLNRDLGFTAQDRVENIRRVAEVAKLMVDAGVLVIASFISPFRADREMARALMAQGEFIEVHVHAPLEVAESRDPKGLYKKARAGALVNFTGIDSPYEVPNSPEFVIATERVSAVDAAQQLFDGLKKLGLY